MAGTEPTNPTASVSTPPRILLTGAAGFVGGTILTQLLNSASPPIRASTITCLVRGTDRAEKLQAASGNRVNHIVYRDLDDFEVTTAVAARHELVISTTLGYHADSARALMEGGSRAADAVVDAGLELGVKTLVLMPPTIYGAGKGIYNKRSTFARWEKGIIFACHGRHSWARVARGVAETCRTLGALADASVESVSLGKGARLFNESYLGGEAKEMMIELGLASNVRTVASIARSLGWRPSRGEAYSKQEFQDDVQAILGERSSR
ncbi:NAD dependent epimerase/dehydratase family protein [Xylariaceae sp. FL0804]|nr:NAD dependent epimerase/dehydratase family protein [Xylariaceae sp. FL0804]